MDLIEKFFIFILFLGPLVFFHELGHFLFARFFKVRCEVFSIGFGPKLFKYKYGDTEYTLSLVPLGGYIKMFGDDPLNKDSIPLDQRPFSFTHKGKWARFWIVMGGPLANFIMAYLLFFGLLLNGERMPEVRLGAIPQQSTFYQKGLRSGDVVKSINGKEIFSPTDIMLDGDGSLRTITVDRRSSLVTVNLHMQSEEFFEEFVKYPPALRRPILVDKDQKYFALSLNREKIDWEISFEEILQISDPETIFYIHPIDVDLNKSEKGSYSPQENSIVTSLRVDSRNREEILKALEQRSFRTIDLTVKSVNMNSPADKGGIKGGDTIYALNGKSVYSFEQLRNSLQKDKNEKVNLGLWRDGKSISVVLTPEVSKQGSQSVKLIGVYSGGDFQPIRFIETASKGFTGATVLAMRRTWDTIIKTVEGFRKLITAEISVKSIGGPMAIGKAASDSFYTSLSYFFQLMALVSVNLGVINLLPIPVLDGGHIMFIFLELVNRGPLSRRKMEVAQQLGLSILLMIMVGAIFNDYSRFF
jgi:regulator of sigma E protease